MSSLEEGSIIGERYRLEHLLARGGMGSVWKAQHLQLKVDVAIKFMSPAFAESTEARVRFEREARASAQLKSPYVVQVHDYGIEGNAPYLVMELLEGEDLEARLRRELRLTPAATLTILRQVCKALRRAHELGLVHRDLKPANIFLAHQSDEEIAKILDFGIAKATSPELVGSATKTGTLLGSPHYMSPEQVRRSKDVDHRSDLWSLGVIAFRCLTGQLPFPGEELGDVLIEICTDPIPIASRIAPDLGPAVDQFFERALMRDPDQRFQSASAFVEAFASIARTDGQAPESADRGAAASSRAPALWPDELPTRAISTSGATPAPFSGPHTPGPISATQAAAVQGGPHAVPPVGGTLAPSGHSLAEPPRSGRRPGIAIAAAGIVLLLAIATFTLLRSSEPTDEGKAASPGPAGAPPSAAAPAPTPPPAAAPSASSAAAEPAASSSASARAPTARPSPPNGGSTPTKKTRRPNDPLDKM